MIQRLTRLADAVSGAAFVLTCLMLAVLAVSILYEVFSRYVIGSPTIWVSEVGSYLVVGITLLGAAWTQRANSHFKMDALEHYFPSLAPAAHVFTCVAIGGFAAFLLWTGVEMTWASYSFGWRTPSLLATPLWIPQSAIPLGAAALLIQALADGLKAVAGLRPARGA